jgi:hypothetical protein
MDRGPGPPDREGRPVTWFWAGVGVAGVALLIVWLRRWK